MVALLIGVIYFGQKIDQDGVMNINGAIFIFLTNMTFQNVFSVINVSINTYNFITFYPSYHEEKQLSFISHYKGELLVERTRNGTKEVTSY